MIISSRGVVFGSPIYYPVSGQARKIRAGRADVGYFVLEI